MNTIIDNEVYAKLSRDGLEVVEYPVYGANIRNRAHPVSWYAKVNAGPMPEVPEFYTVKENLQIIGNAVLVTYELVPDSLDKILASLYNAKEQSTTPGQLPAPVVFSELSSSTIGRIKTLSKAAVQKKMDDFAGIKEYDGISSACSYAYSTIAAFKADGEKCVTIRDTSWTRLYMYFDKVASGEEAVPRNTAQILAILPDMSW